MDLEDFSDSGSEYQPSSEESCSGSGKLIFCFSNLKIVFKFFG